MPEGGREPGCPLGYGNGTYEPLKSVGAVVGVVGTAHVHGISEHIKNQASQMRKGVIGDPLSLKP
jgi:hypothetical protein